MTRRDFLTRAAAALPATAATVPPAFATLLARPAATPAPPQAAPARTFTLNLVCGMIGVSAKTQAEVNALAARHGFESVEARGEELAAMNAGSLATLREDMAAKKIVFGAAGLPNGMRADSATFDDDIRKLPALAAGLQRAGVTRLSTWISPGSDTHTYLQNFKRHVARVGEIARICDGEGVRFGLEYIGTPTLRRKPRHGFIHSMAEARELFAEIPFTNVGFVLDTWHWFTALEGEAELLSVKPHEIVTVDLNDAPAGVPLLDQLDNQRELPATTGVIDIATFVTALVTMGYDGPARAEPFNATLNAMENDEACATTIAALKRAVGKIRT
jgi:sugar phosphate isomerase/epimerase